MARCLLAADASSCVSEMPFRETDYACGATRESGNWAGGEPPPEFDP